MTTLRPAADAPPRTRGPSRALSATIVPTMTVPPSRVLSATLVSPVGVPRPRAYRSNRTLLTVLGPSSPSIHVTGQNQFSNAGLDDGPCISIDSWLDTVDVAGFGGDPSMTFAAPWSGFDGAEPDDDSGFVSQLSRKSANSTSSLPRFPNTVVASSGLYSTSWHV